MAQVGCPDRRIDRLCITCCSPSQPSHHAMVLGAISSDPQRGWIIISLAPSHHCPGHSGELVGKRRRSSVIRPLGGPKRVLGAIPTLPQGPRMTGRLPPSSTERNCSSSGSLKHAFEPSLFEPKSPLPGNGIFKPETNGPKRRRSSRRGDRETKPTRRTRRFGANRRVRGNLP